LGILDRALYVQDTSGSANSYIFLTAPDYHFYTNWADYASLEYKADQSPPYLHILTGETDSNIRLEPYGYTYTNKNFKINQDNVKLYFGLNDDVCSYFDGSAMIITAEVGTPDLNFTGFGDININSDLDVTNNFTGNQIYGEMWYHNHTATELSFDVDGTYYNLTFSNSSTNGFYFNDSGDYLEAQVAGKYLINYMASGDGDNNHVYYTAVTINGVVHDNSESHKKMTAGGDIITMSGTGITDLSAGDKIKLATADVGDTGTGNYYSSNINLVRIGT